MSLPFVHVKLPFVDVLTIILILSLIFIVVIIAKRKMNTSKKQANNNKKEYIQPTEAQADTDNKIQTAFADPLNPSFAKEQQSKEAVSKNAVVRSVIAKKKDQ